PSLNSRMERSVRAPSKPCSVAKAATSSSVLATTPLPPCSSATAILSSGTALATTGCVAYRSCTRVSQKQSARAPDWDTVKQELVWSPSVSSQNRRPCSLSRIVWSLWYWLSLV